MRMMMMTMTMLKVDNRLHVPSSSAATPTSTPSWSSTQTCPSSPREIFLFSMFAQCVSKNLWHNIFYDLSKLRGNFGGDDANPFLWDNPTFLYMQHKHIVTKYTRLSKYQIWLDGIPTSNVQSKCYCSPKFPGLNDCCCQWFNHFLKIFKFCWQVPIWLWR